MTVAERPLPPMASRAEVSPTVTRRILSSCWRNFCFNDVDPEDALGLCDDHKEALRG